MGQNIPLRKCLGCGEMLGKKGLMRIVRTKDGEISLDPTGKKSGRLLRAGSEEAKLRACAEMQYTR